MKLHNLLLTSTTALGLSMTAAVADSNESSIKQDGTENTALIQQGGEFNRAGRLAGGVVRQSILQNGNNNEIDIDQSGNENAIGVNAGADSPSVLGKFRQDGQRNKATVTQSGNDNILRDVTQNTPTGASVYSTPRNRLIVTQSGDDNAIRTVDQFTSAFDKDGNIADITMSGNNNRIEQIEQSSEQGGAGDTSNEMTVVISGMDNGRPNSGFGQGALTGLSDVATSGHLVQIGGSNMIDLNISGNSNQFGIRQDGGQAGNGNTVGSVIIAGDSNQLGVNQDGNGNTLALAAIALGSDENIIGVDQIGNNNTASATVDGDQNEFGIKQDGGANYGEINIIGDLNGVPGVGFSGDADSVLTGNPMMTSGLLQQFGDENSVIVNVDGDSNSFATLQNNETMGAGTGNTITGTINGSSNQVAIAQVGGNNSTTFTQNGSFNNLGVTQ